MGVYTRFVAAFILGAAIASYGSVLTLWLQDRPLRPSLDPTAVAIAGGPIHRKPIDPIDVPYAFGAHLVLPSGEHDIVLSKVGPAAEVAIDGKVVPFVTFTTSAQTYYVGP